MGIEQSIIMKSSRKKFHHQTIIWRILFMQFFVQLDKEFKFIKDFYSPYYFKHSSLTLTSILDFQDNQLSVYKCDYPKILLSH